jgi:hypothetical protein
MVKDALIWAAALPVVNSLWNNFVVSHTPFDRGALSRACDLGTSIPSEFPSSTTGLRFLDLLGDTLWAAGGGSLAEVRPVVGEITLGVNLVLDGSRGYRAAAKDDR